MAKECRRSCSFSSWKRTPIEAKIITRQIERAQKSIEGIHYSQRKHVLQYDEVNNKQRQVIYGDRNKVLNGEDVHGMILDMAAGFARKALEDACDGTENSRLWNLDAVNGILKKTNICLSWRTS